MLAQANSVKRQSNWVRFVISRYPLDGCSMSSWDTTTSTAAGSRVYGAETTRLDALGVVQTLHELSVGMLFVPGDVRRRRQFRRQR